MLQFNLVNMICTVVNLLILVFLVWKFLLKPVRKIIAQRQEEAEAEFAKAEADKKEAADLKAQYEASMAGIADEKAQILKESRTQAAEEYDKIVAKAKEESESIIDDARKQVEANTIRRERQAKRELADVVIDATNIIAGSHQDEKIDRALYDEFIAKLGEDSE